MVWRVTPRPLFQVVLQVFKPSTELSVVEIKFDEFAEVLQTKTRVRLTVVGALGFAMNLSKAS
jgi:hypothetical protein